MSDRDPFYLFIDAHVRGRMAFAMIPLNIQQEIVAHEVEGSRNLVGEAERFFGPHAKRACGIMVVAGPGSFSSIRSGVLVANLMSRLLGIPLYGMEAATDRVDLSALRQDLASGRLAPRSYIAPIYDQEPNITVRVA